MICSVPYGVVYVIINLVNGKLYVGQTINLKRRWYSHKRSNQDSPLQSAIKKYGWNKFDMQVVAHADSPESLDRLEEIWIAFLGTLKPANGYNQRPGGKTSRFTEESRKKMSESAKGHKNCLGVKRPDVIERNKRMAGRNPKKPRKPYVSNARPIEEQRRIQVEGLRKWLLTDAGKEKQRKALEARWADPEKREKFAREAKIRYSTPEAKEKMRQMNARRWVKEAV